MPDLGGDPKKVFPKQIYGGTEKDLKKMG